LFYISALFLFADVFVTLQYPVCDIDTVDFFAWWTVWFHVRDPGTTLVWTHSTRRMFLMYGGGDKVKKLIKKKVIVKKEKKNNHCEEATTHQTLWWLKLQPVPAPTFSKHASLAVHNRMFAALQISFASSLVLPDSQLNFCPFFKEAGAFSFHQCCLFDR
jgi:hypothetical protein